jgi:hypothetical protein
MLYVCEDRCGILGMHTVMLGVFPIVERREREEEKTKREGKTELMKAGGGICVYLILW